MASPQLEDGYTRIANELLEACIKAKLSGLELRLMLFIMRKTYGYQKKDDFVSLTQMAGITGASKARCSQVIGRLASIHVLTVTENLNGIGKKYMINKDFDKWLTVPKNGNRSQNASLPFSKSVTLPFSKMGTTKERRKETIQKKEDIYVETSDEVRLSRLLLTFILQNKPTHQFSHTPPNIQTWAADVNKMIRIDKRPPEQIEEVLRWSQADAFWWKNICSATKLRKQFDRLEADMQSQGRRHCIEDLPRLHAQLKTARKEAEHWRLQVESFGAKHQPKLDEQLALIRQLEPEIKRLEGVKR
ncbi:hypothetical protein C4565_03730 [Candidatus Parcubacteria bacterium]|nr:MAG: hypothetical protein C4565_03730 [Candidatus Parcubacteria bacterium]